MELYEDYRHVSYATDERRRSVSESCQSAFNPMLSRETRVELARFAESEDAGQQSVSASIDRLRDLGWLEAALPTDAGGANIGRGSGHAAFSVRTLMELAQANLSAARLYEGHVNALRLLGLFAPEVLRERGFDYARHGNLLGVWAADGAEPVVLDKRTDRLHGRKRYASGLGVVDHAVISVRVGAGISLALADTSDIARQDPAAWNMSGMRASASGEFDFSGCDRSAYELFGEPGDYFREPWFLGGMWRIAAIQLGGIFGLLETSRRYLKKIERLAATAQVERLTTILEESLGAIGLVEKAAATGDTDEPPSDPEPAVALSIYARLHTEEIGQRAIAAVERSIGLEHFTASSTSGRMARDLAVYLRQVARDALLQRAGLAALYSDRDLLDLWYGCDKRG